MLPIKKTYVHSLKQEGERVRISLKTLETLTYSCTNPDDLREVGNEIENIITLLKEKLPKSEGIIIRPEARKAVRKQALNICCKYRKLPMHIKRGPNRKDWRYHNRVGRKVDKLRKAAQKALSDISNTVTQRKVTEVILPQCQTLKAGQKRKRCNKCDGCLAVDCGTCTNCKDKKIFGGPGIKKQCCKQRRCISFLTPSQVLKLKYVIC